MNMLRQEPGVWFSGFFFFRGTGHVMIVCYSLCFDSGCDVSVSLCGELRAVFGGG